MTRHQQHISFESELNPQQHAVVTAGAGPMLVIAGAGSGKTRTLTYRVAHLIERGVDPHRILLLTFTNKAAREMLYRVESIVPFDVKKIWGGTFHHIGNRILRAHIERLGYRPAYTILDQTDARDLMEQCIEELGLRRKDGPIPKASVLAGIVSLSRNIRKSLDEVVDRRYPFLVEFVEDVRSIADRYTEKKKELNVLDFDDLLCLWLQLLESHPDLRRFYTDRFEHILVDEYQDTNKLQADIIDMMASTHRNIMAVGDDAQSIYAFRGANFANIIEFPRRYPDTAVYKLEHNYRSCPEILSLANESITNNLNQFHKVLQPIKGSGSIPYVILPSNVNQQAKFVATGIQELIYNGVPPDEIAVLYRAHYHSMELQMEMTRRKVPFTVRSGMRFFEMAHIKDLVSYLKISVNPHDETAWRRILQLMPGVGKKTCMKIINRLTPDPDPLEACCRESTTALVPRAGKASWPSLQSIVAALRAQGPGAAPAALMKAALDAGYTSFLQRQYTDAPSRAEDLEQFIGFARQYVSSSDFLGELALLSGNETDTIDDTAPGETVKLSTIHQAKGLEWSVVFILSLIEGRFPNPNNFESIEDEEEERRLFYVAVTRAKDRLYLCSPLYAKDAGGYSSISTPSRFLREINEACYKKVDSFSCYEAF